jgi:hypothetical protein
MSKSGRQLFSTISGNGAALAAGFIVIVALVCDLVFSAFLDALDGQLVSALGIAVFAALAAAIYGAGIYLLTGFVRQLSKGIRSKSRFFGVAYQAVAAIQYLLVGIFAVITAEMALFSSYHVGLLAAAVAASLAPAAVIMAVHSYRFLLWFGHRKSALVLLYGLSPGLAFAATAVMLYIDLSRLLALPAVKEPAQQVTIQLISSMPALGGLFVYAYVLPLVLSLVSIWIGTAIHLQHYSEKIGKAKYWVMIWMPLASFVAVLFVNVGLITAGDSDSMLGASRLALFSSATASIIVIGLSFLTMARSLPRGEPTAALKGYLVMIGLGVMMESISLMTFVYGNWPPFGILGHSFLALASYIYILGLYSSAVSVSADVELRRSIRKLASELKLLNGIGTAQMEREFQGRVFAIAKSHLDTETDDQQPLSEDDIKRYMEEVASELKKKRGAAVA